ncbi:RNA polymerase B [Agyrium rufum]|nr:RNA polymerase B [Agyrium rufum]
MAANQPPKSRAREKPVGDEEATSDLKLGEFQQVPTLSLSEARILINAVIDARKLKRPFEETEILTKTQDYLDVFARFKEKDNVQAVEQILGSHTELNTFERSQLGSLCCDTWEEAETLIPSIKDKMSQNELQEMLDEITKLRALYVTSLVLLLWIVFHYMQPIGYWQISIS